MTAIAKDQLKPYALGHLGLAGAFIRECGLIDKRKAITQDISPMVRL